MADDLRAKIAETIWNTSRADEGTISATGANIIADALLPLVREREAEVREEIAARIDAECPGCGENTPCPYARAVRIARGGGER